MTRKCKICGGVMVASGKVQYKHPISRRRKESKVIRCQKCGHRMIE
jgi:DNA-directed RNA polymerase subunit RPC12/RpoP